jgi:hypothetical protein
MDALLLLLFYFAAISPTLVFSIATLTTIGSVALTIPEEEGDRARVWPMVSLLALAALSYAGILRPALAFYLAGAVAISAFVAAAALNEFGYRRAVAAVAVFASGATFGLLHVAARKYVESLQIFV